MHGLAGPDVDAVVTTAPAPGDPDLDAVTRLLGRRPRGDFEVVVRDGAGVPVVIRNAPFLADGTPMPTRYWLVGEEERDAVSRLESQSGVSEAEAGVDPDELTAAHARYAAERSAAIAPGWSGPRPEGGVGGTRRGVKCLHAHLAWFLAGGDDPVGRHVAWRLGGAPVAAVDCGTNSTRLLVAAPWPFSCGLLDPPAAVSGCLAASGSTPPLVTLRREMRITRLGEGVDREGALRATAIERTVEVLESYREFVDALGVRSVRAVATSAVRDAENREEFLVAAGEALGTRPEVIDGEVEGQLSFAGATADIAALTAVPGRRASSPTPPDIAVVVDIGGGSTELVVGDLHVGDEQAAPAIRAAVSLPVGCVRLSERYLVGDPPSPESIAAARAVVRSVLEEAARATATLLTGEIVVGLAGTVSALAMLDLRLDRYDIVAVHRHEMTRATVESLLAELAGMSLAERRQRGVEEGRLDVIVGGAVVLAETMGFLGSESLVVSERDILDGIARSLVDQSQPPVDS
jgi:exopolyphosphatase/guanosine-5'-triphosphate,3'-diphosphate pyrophosphatase